MPTMRAPFIFALLATVATTVATTAVAATPPCRPCSGISTVGPAAAALALAAAPPVDPEARLYVRWRVSLDGSGAVAGSDALAAAGATPWVALVFTTPAPVTEHVDSLASELAEAARLAAATPERTHFEILWEPGDAAVTTPADYAFLLKRASVAVVGARPGARVITAPQEHDPGRLRALYGEEIAPYVDGVAVVPASSATTAATVALLTELDPGRPVVVSEAELPAGDGAALAVAAANAALGVDVTLFRIPVPDAALLAPFTLLAREFKGDLSVDPYSTPTGVAGAWAFVRGEDLGLRLVVDASLDSDRAELVFSDTGLADPVLVSADGSTRELSAQRTARGLVVTVVNPPPVAVLRLSRLSAAELGGFAEEVDVASLWQMPVEEILRRLQVFEDRQTRRIDHYEADKTMHLRFSAGAGTGSIEAAFAGEFFFRPETGFDWAWRQLFVNGVKWRGTLPELPLIQPEKAASLPFAIHFTKEYAYTLRRSDVVEGRDCWVVDFAPVGDGEADKLFKGTVWVDRELFTRVKTRAIQLGLTGDVISNEETVYYRPVNADGTPAEWTPAAFFLPLRTVGQEVDSVLNAAFHVERETVLERIRVNQPGFAERLAAVQASDTTMVRDTDQGMRYLTRQEDGSRVVKDDTDFDSLFLVGGVFWDESADYPLPIAGVNYFSRDFKDSGKQVDVFFAGIFVNANLAEPHLFDSKWDVGARLFGFFIPTDEVLYRDGVEIDDEAVSSRSSRLGLFLGRPLGSFTKLSLTYGLSHDAFARADDTRPDFVIPSDTLTHAAEAELAYTRSGYRLRVDGSLNQRADWQPWGVPGSGDYDADHESFARWKVSAAKSWWLNSFQKVALELEHVGGENLDRFSKYDFSTFADTEVAGYQRGLITATEASGAHLGYGFNLAEAMRIELRGDAMWASDEATGLDRELLAGVSFNGTVIGPWQTIVNFDIGVPVSGPGDGFTATIAFLKLFN